MQFCAGTAADLLRQYANGYASSCKLPRHNATATATATAGIASQRSCCNCITAVPLQLALTDEHCQLEWQQHQLAPARALHAARSSAVQHSANSMSHNAVR
jgi:hypothetical protein